MFRGRPRGNALWQALNGEGCTVLLLAVRAEATSQSIVCLRRRLKANGHRLRQLPHTAGLATSRACLFGAWSFAVIRR